MCWFPMRRSIRIWSIFIPTWITSIIITGICVSNYYSNMMVPINTKTNKSESGILNPSQEDINRIRKLMEEIVRQLVHNRVKDQQRISRDVYSYNSTVTIYAPHSDYERVRRHMYATIHEMWYFANAQISFMKNKMEDETLTEMADKMLHMFGAFKRSLIYEINELMELDGHRAWRYDENAKLSYEIERILHYIQNPKDCKTAKKLRCTFESAHCGIGCQIHHLVDCLIMAYVTQRTLVLEGQKFTEHEHSPSWNDFFLPLSNTCLNVSGDPATLWNPTAEFSEAQALWYPHTSTLHDRKPHYLPLSVPEEVATRLKRIHGDPIVWWVGQFLKYLLRPTPSFRKYLFKLEARMGFQKPIVGIQVRKNDKQDSNQTTKFKLDEYMFHIEEYYRQVKMSSNITKKRIYVVTDVPEIFSELERNYPEYEIIADREAHIFSKSEDHHHSKMSSRNFITNVHFLSRTDFLVCTFSSRVCRMSYEVMNHLNYDASQKCHSLDSNYFYAGQVRKRRQQDIFIDYNAFGPEELNLKKGDTVELFENYHNGYSRGRHLGKMDIGLFPSFMGINEVGVTRFPFPYAPLMEEIMEEES